MEIYLLIFSVIVLVSWLILKVLDKPLDQMDMDLLLAFISLMSIMVKRKLTNWWISGRKVKQSKSKEDNKDRGDRNA